MMSATRFHNPEVQPCARAGWMDVAYAWAVGAVVVVLMVL